MKSSVGRFFDTDADDVRESTEEELKAKFIEHLNTLKSMDVREQTLYQKWYEISHDYKWAIHSSQRAKARIWTPTNLFNKEQTIAELSALRPVLRCIHPENVAAVEEWTLLRVFVSTFNFDQSPGRFLRFLLEDEPTGKVLGIVSIASDVMTIGVRDQYIGWTEEQKADGMLNHTAIGTTIVATQPLGYNFLGGKLVAAMLTTEVVRQVWKDKYGDVLAGLTTTSLYGDGSMYNSIPWWKSLGETQGKIPIKPSNEFYEPWHKVIKKKYPEKYQDLSWNDDGVVATGVKQKIINLIFKEVGIKPTHYIHGFNRGVYFAPLYENTKDFLVQKITEPQLRPLQKNPPTSDAVWNWWLKKAINRYEKLHTENRLKPEILFYNDIITGQYSALTWLETKEKYLGEVGR
jgi:hypothetical protein